MIQEHFLCLYANKVNGTFIIIDPKGLSVVLAAKCFSNWKNFAKNNISLNQIEWNDRSMLIKCTQPKQIDDYNCGLFVAYFLKFLLTDNFLFCFDTSILSLKHMRLEMAQSIIESVID